MPHTLLWNEKWKMTRLVFTVSRWRGEKTIDGQWEQQNVFQETGEETKEFAGIKGNRIAQVRAPCTDLRLVDMLVIFPLIQNWLPLLLPTVSSLLICIRCLTCCRGLLSSMQVCINFAPWVTFSWGEFIQIRASRINYEYLVTSGSSSQRLKLF